MVLVAPVIVNFNRYLCFILFSSKAPRYALGASQFGPAVREPRQARGAVPLLIVEHSDSKERIVPTKKVDRIGVRSQLRKKSVEARSNRESLIDDVLTLRLKLKKRPVFVALVVPDEFIAAKVRRFGAMIDTGYELEFYFCHVVFLRHLARNLS